MIGVITPVVLATIAFYLFESGGQSESLLYAALGAGLMGIWSTTLFGSGGAIQWQRWQGTLELLIAAPVPFIVVLVPLTLATAAYGLVSLVSTLVWGRVLFGIQVDLVHPILFVIAVPSAVIGLGLLGLLLASTFVLYRNANALSNLLGEPVWLITGMLVPISLLPGWAQGVSHANPILYMVNAFRFGFLGVSDVNVGFAYTIMIGAAVVLYASCVWLLQRGVGTRE